MHTVVQITLDRAPIGVGSKNEPRPGRAQVGDLGAQPLELVVSRLELFSVQSYRPPGRGPPGLSAVAPATSSRPALA
jgi:hypothetical protein